MSIAEKLSTIAENVPKVYNAGKQAEYDEFWDSYLNIKESYVAWFYRFAGYGWNEYTFKPPCDIVVTGAATGMFMMSGIRDLKALCDKVGVVIDFSKATSFTQIFSDSYIDHVGIIDTRVANKLDYILYSATKMVTVDKIILKSDGSQTFKNGFNNCTELKNITIEGKIAYSIDFKYSPLSKDSILSVFNALSDAITGQTLTLKLSAVNTAFETSAGAADGSTSEEWATLIATKPNWTISLV